MDIDLDLYRHEIRVSTDPLVRLSALDVSPDRPQRTFVFLHGFGGQALQWIYQMQKFSLQNRVIALDLRGHGLSDKPITGYDMPTMLADIETALDTLRVTDPVVLVGHSFGGALATEFALGGTFLRRRARDGVRARAPGAGRASCADGHRGRVPPQPPLPAGTQPPELAAAPDRAVHAFVVVRAAARAQILLPQQPQPLERLGLVQVARRADARHSRPPRRRL